ncbi:MAG: TIGR03936 family radical SAM-associated protein [Clostridia bacterium]|nr:TIGR03936 family radical SAM-associated protein [Clostridia bacterium]
MSESQKLIEKKRIKSLPELERPRTVRLKFIKVGSLQYISHLDLQRTFNRVIVRACLPIWYTKGFNPHAKLVFSTPLSIGAQSTCEFLDIRIDREMSCETIMERLNAELTEELKIVDAYIPERDFADIKWASYDISITSGGISENTPEQIMQRIKEPIFMLKKTKAGEKEIDITGLIHSFSCKLVEGDIKISCTLSASSTEYLNPELLISGLARECDLLCGSPLEEHYDIIRTSLYDAEFNLFK